MCCVGERKLKLGDFVLEALPGDEALTLMHVPVGISVSDVQLLGFIIEKARSKFFGMKEIPQSKASLKARLGLMDKILLERMRWMLGCLFPTAKLQEMLNGFQIWCIRAAMNLKWKGQGVHAEFEINALRLARAALHHNQGIRWGNMLIKQFWGYLGHRVRDGDRQAASTAGVLSHFRTLEWWEQQQTSRDGLRHGGAHFPQLMNRERAIARHCGGGQETVGINGENTDGNVGANEENNAENSGVEYLQLDEAVGPEGRTWTERALERWAREGRLY